VARFYVYDSQAEAQADVDGIDARARTIYAGQGYEIDAEGNIISKDGATGANAPGAPRTVTWDVPRQRLDGRWVIGHCEGVPGASFVLDASRSPPLTVADFVGQGIAASVSVETEIASWWPASPADGAIA
jgi:hypothetical protein